ncbi:hypothetical protein RI129_008488 [Pyrocoelia pectoralis]|uniref:Uncharacterized protein n=1 Tax=Pyrocoelia pectoralis TaxID=417401 RepID=A0AAN7ZKT4_9COLE
MQLIVFVLLLISYTNKCLCFKVQFLSCDEKGFHCNNSATYEGKKDVTYQCPSDDLKDITIDFWIWDLPQEADIGKLTIKHCHTLRLRFGCTEHYRNITSLYVHHVADLRIFEDDTICNPSGVIFEQVHLLRNVPKHSFSQARSKCNAEHCGLKQLVFENVKIGVIETGGIELIDNIELFRITNTVINTIEVGGIKIVVHKDASIYIINSIINNVEAVAVQVVAPTFTISETNIGEISFAGISATVNAFEFSSNFVANTSSGALAVSAGQVDIFKNSFYSINSGAFSKIGPRQKRFSYNFLENYIKYVDIGGLHPQVESFQEFRLNITYASNSFYCTCEELAWLGSGISFGRGYNPVKDFYKGIMDKVNNNTCTFDLSCTLPLRAVEKIAPDGVCQIITVDDQSTFCENYQDNSSKYSRPNSHFLILLYLLLLSLFI